jgi:hypothetical protein
MRLSSGEISADIRNHPKPDLPREDAAAATIMQKMTYITMNSI